MLKTVLVLYTIRKDFLIYNFIAIMLIIVIVYYIIVHAENYN